ncbi:RNase P modulator RnpM [Sinanaerobacter sp. ZZT-01]|uniref:RNase P modulator RnpM n=1 Tax=Sinanaerobacter sp. ZZT-01 TaxID=3111540 RepID=UPI002D772B42|nr:YlxR family protein [Sinanaerobacter sp. ZZT-01]WRR93229.1 YlxR family protein [Sinanaerobacter sp. ZZT-01]
MKVKKIPMRRCAGCMESKPKRELIRIVAEGEHSLRIDSTGKANGRGVYLCPNHNCFTLAKKKKAIGRNLNINISEEELNRVFEELTKYEAKD